MPWTMDIGQLQYENVDVNARQDGKTLAVELAK
jgi:hypothetical protein